MKRIFLVVVLVFIQQSLMAQKQYGYVRTKGTSTNIKGTPLENVKVKINGLQGNKVSDRKGLFNFELGGGKTQFSVKEVIKSGFRVFGSLASSYNVGKARLEIAMEPVADREVAKQQLTNEKLSKALAQYESKVTMLQKEKKQLEVSLVNEKQKSAKLSLLEDSLKRVEETYQDTRRHIDDIVEAELNRDFATMDSAEVQFYLYLDKGETDKAELLRKSMGIDIATIQKNIAEIEADVNRLNKEKEAIVQMKADVRRQLRMDYDLAIEKLDFASAASKIMQLADEDTTDLNTVFECAKFLQRENDFKHASQYYNIFLRQSLKVADSDSLVCDPNLATIYNNMGNLYSSERNYAQSERYYRRALTIYSELAADDSLSYKSGLATTYNNLAVLYSDCQEDAKAEQYYQQAFSIYRQLAADNPVAYNAGLAGTCNNLAVFYNDRYDYSKAGMYFLQALPIYKELAESSPSVYDPTMALLYNNLGSLHSNQHEYDEAESYYLQALSIRLKLATANPLAYNPDLASTYTDLGVLYRKRHCYEKAMEYSKHALSIRKELASLNPSAYNSDLAETYDNMGTLFSSKKDFTEAAQYYQQALIIRKELASANPSVYNFALSSTYYNMGVFYYQNHDYEKAESYYQQALTIRQELASNNPVAYKPVLASTYNSLGDLYFNINDSVKAKQNYLQALTIYKDLSSSNSSAYNTALIKLYYNLGFYYYCCAEYSKSGEYFEPALSLLNESASNKQMIANIKGYMSDIALYSSKFALAEQYASEALALDSTLVWLNKNLVIAILLQGRYAEAEKLVIDIKDMMYEEGTLKDLILSCLTDLDIKEIIPQQYRKDVSKITTKLKAL